MRALCVVYLLWVVGCGGRIDDQVAPPSDAAQEAPSEAHDAGAPHAAVDADGHGYPPPWPCPCPPAGNEPPNHNR